MDKAIEFVVRHYESLGVKMIFNDEFIKVEECWDLGPDRADFIKPGNYYFELVDLPQYLRSPELIEIIVNTCFNRERTLKAKYVEFPYLAPKSEPLLNKDDCVYLSGELINLCQRFLEIKNMSVETNYLKDSEKRYYFGVIGEDDLETLEQRVENFLLTGRVDRVCKFEGAKSGPEFTCGRILKEHGKEIKTVVVLNGSFEKVGDPRVVKDRFRRVIV